MIDKPEKRIDAQLLVLLKGADLCATTAFLTLVKKMGYAKSLAGIKRFDYFRFALETRGGEPRTTVDALKRVLDRQSTFYNRNKHVYSLSCFWDGDSLQEGQNPDEIQNRWTKEIRKSLIEKGDKDFVGKPGSKPVILEELSDFLAEVLVEDEDRSGRESIAAKLQSDLGAAQVVCKNRATLWWLALRARGAEEARALAEEIAVTTRRDRGLLLNPNYQHAEFISVRKIGRASDD